MIQPFRWAINRLALLVVLSSIVLTVPSLTSAHEVQPTVGDLTVENGVAVLDLRINLEAFLANIDLDAVEDTNDAENAEDYDALRALSPEEIAELAPELLEDWNALPVLTVDGTPVELESTLVEVPADVDIEASRVSVWTLKGDVSAAPQSAVVQWPAGGGAMVLRQQGVEEPFTGYLDGGKESPVIALGGGNAMSAMQAFVSYIPVGFDHIVPKGLDHILFVLGLFFLSTRMRPLIWQVSAFTLAHTVTLALGALGWVNIPGEIVEPIIAASIVYVAVENILTAKLNPWRPLIIFGFGLLHGLGFASVLGEFGLPQGQFIPALIGFNIGVEFGQLTVIAIAFVLVGWASRRPWYRSRIAVPASCVIALVGAYWFVERVFL